MFKSPTTEDDLPRKERRERKLLGFYWHLRSRTEAHFLIGQVEIGSESDWYVI